MFIVFCTRALSFLRKSPAISAKEPYKDYTSTSSQPTKGLACFVITIALQSCVSISTKELCYIRKRALSYLQKSPIKAKEPYKVFTGLLCRYGRALTQKCQGSFAENDIQDCRATVMTKPANLLVGWLLVDE